MTTIINEATALAVQRRVVFRLATFFLLLQLMNAIDRSNVSFAATAMNADLGFDAQVYGFGISCFFLSYIFFQFPAIFAMRRFGPSKTLGLIVVSWGLVSMAMAAVQDAYSFYVLRFLLGMTEAGAVPVMLYYASCWTPQKNQGAFFKIMTLSWPLAVVIGAPIASLLMNHLGQIGGLPGWRWLFIAEGIPTVALGLFALIWLADSPAHARNLSEPERQWLVAQLEHDKAVAEAAAPQQAKGSFLMSALADRRVWLLSLAYFGEIAGLYGAVFWLPQVIGQLSPAIGSDRATLLTMVPFAVGTVTLLLNAARSDRKQERSWHITGGFLVGALGLGSAGLISNPWLGFVALTIGIAGLCAATGLFWSIPTGMFRGLAHAAAAFTLINVVGNVSGLVIPAVIGMLRVATGDFSNALLLLAGLLLMSAAMIRIVGEPGAE